MSGNIFIRDFLYVPRSAVSKRDLKNRFRMDHFDEKVCATMGEYGSVCPERRQRPTDVCKSCVGNLGRYRFYRKSSISGRDYVGLAMGDAAAISDVLSGIPNAKGRIVDQRCNTRMMYPVLFDESKLYAFQKKAVEILIQYERGVLKSPPRSGKTVMFAYLSCLLGLRTLVLTHQDDLLRQFLQAFQTFTNVAENNITLIRRNSHLATDADVVLATYQRFLHAQGRKALPDFGSGFGLVLVDEIHRGNATGYAKVISHMSPRRIYGCSGTLERKDGKQFIMRRVIGPLRHDTHVDTLHPKVYVHESKLKRRISAVHWTAIIRRLSADPPRNMDIVKHVVEDLDRGRHIVIPATFRWYIDAMVEEINRSWMLHKGSEEIIAAPFYRYPNPNTKEQILEDARSGRIRATVAMRSMLLGVNVPIWDCLYEVIPLNNAPVLEQEALRICTPLKNKPLPIIRFFVDVGLGVSVRCFMSCWRTMQGLGFDTLGNEDTLRNIRGALAHGVRDSGDSKDCAGIGRPGIRL